MENTEPAREETREVQGELRAQGVEWLADAEDGEQPPSLEEWLAEEHEGEAMVWKDAQMFYTVMAMFDYEADRKGWSLDEVRFQRKEEGSVLAILKASKGRRRLVAFVGGKNFYDCWRELQETKRTEGFAWKPDRYAKL